MFSTEVWVAVRLTDSTSACLLLSGLTVYTESTHLSAVSIATHPRVGRVYTDFTLQELQKIQAILTGNILFLLSDTRLYNVIVCLYTGVSAYLGRFLTFNLVEKLFQMVEIAS